MLMWTSKTPLDCIFIVWCTGFHEFIFFRVVAGQGDQASTMLFACL